MRKEQLIAIYNDHEDSAKAIETLLKAGISKKDISVLAKTILNSIKKTKISYFGANRELFGARYGDF